MAFDKEKSIAKPEYVNHKQAGALLLVEDDKSDQLLIKEAFLTLKISNEIVIAEDGREALKYLRSGEIQPILILCDINMPRMNGLELREEIFKDLALRKKCIPFIFMSTNANKGEVDLAFEYAVQGFFEKAMDFDEAVSLLKVIIDYWKKCKHPNSEKFKL